MILIQSAIFFSKSRFNNLIFRPLTSTSPSFFKSESRRISVSVAVPTKLLRSSLVTLSFNVPSSSTPKSEAINNRISANRDFTDFCAMSRMYRLASPSSLQAILHHFISKTRIVGDHVHQGGVGDITQYAVGHCFYGSTGGFIANDGSEAENISFFSETDNLVLTGNSGLKEFSRYRRKGNNIL